MNSKLNSIIVSSIIAFALIAGIPTAFVSVLAQDDGGDTGGTTDGGATDGGTTDGGDTSGTTDGGDTSGTTDGGDTSGTTDGGDTSGTTDGGDTDSMAPGTGNATGVDSQEITPEDEDDENEN